MKKKPAPPAPAAELTTTAPVIHPLSNVQWVDPSTLRPNPYNPNRVFKPELELLKLSIMSDGWTMPIVATPDGEIVDGFHRWTLGSTDADIRKISGGLVPVVRTRPRSAADQKAATVRHNRARGQHGVLLMADIVRSMISDGKTPEEVATMLGMEEDEVDRLADERGSPERVGKDSFGRGWVPVPKV